VGQRVAGKVALISGAARGQGAAHAALLAREGAAVVLGDVLDQAGEEHAESLRAEGLDAQYLHLDVTNPANWEAAVQLAESTYERLNVLVNNAGIVNVSRITETTDDEWNRTILVNQTGVFYGMRACIPAIKRSGGGAIVNTSSVFALRGTDGYVAYNATKAAVLSMTRSAALTYAGDNIRVNAICPGLALTKMVDEEGEKLRAAGMLQSDDFIEEFLGVVPMRRGCDPSEVAAAVLFLVSDEASYVTGTELVVDGGYLAG
jgi:3alpha(or 20beta)-hydroxysteroid dehydrogenase